MNQDITKLPHTADVFEDKDCHGIWIVAADDSSNTGEIYTVTFDGDHANARALEYAKAKFSEFRLQRPR